VSSPNNERDESNSGPKEPLEPWLRWGFATLVVIAAACGALVGALAEPPADLPGYALDSSTIYRLELTLAAFALVYVPLTTVFLAFQGRAFVKLTAGPASIEAEKVRALRAAAGEIQRTASLHERDIEDLLNAVEDLAVRMRRVEALLGGDR
jgi:hypothetical protein